MYQLSICHLWVLLDGLQHNVEYIFYIDHMQAAWLRAWVLHLHANYFECIQRLGVTTSKWLLFDCKRFVFLARIDCSSALKCAYGNSYRLRLICCMKTIETTPVCSTILHYDLSIIILWKFINDTRLKTTSIWKRKLSTINKIDELEHKASFLFCYTNFFFCFCMLHLEN